MYKLRKKMNSSNILGLISILLAFFFSISLSSACEKQGKEESDIYKYLPEDTGDWKRNDIPQLYQGDDLYLYINGGAEIYQEYGFDRVTVQDYKSNKGKSLSLEIYQMSNSESAYGIFSFKRSGAGTKLDLGSEGRLDDYYLNFWKGKFLVTLTGFDEAEDTVRGLQIIARAVDGKIEDSGAKPSLLNLLPEKNIIDASIKYFRGNLGLYNINSYFAKSFPALKQGIKGDYTRGGTVYVIEYESAAQCSKKFEEAKLKFDENPLMSTTEKIEKTAIRLEDKEGNLIYVSSFQNYILIVDGAESDEQAAEMLSRIKKNKNDGVE